MGVPRLSACLSKGHTRCSRARALVELLLAAVTFTAAVALLFGIEKDRLIHRRYICLVRPGRYTQHSNGLVASDLLNLCLACLHPSRWVVLCVKSITGNNNGNNKTSILSSALATFNFELRLPLRFQFLRFFFFFPRVDQMCSVDGRNEGKRTSCAD